MNTPRRRFLVGFILLIVVPLFAGPWDGSSGHSYPIPDTGWDSSHSINTGQSGSEWLVDGFARIEAPVQTFYAWEATKVSWWLDVTTIAQGSGYGPSGQVSFAAISDAVYYDVVARVEGAWGNNPGSAEAIAYQ